jgi:DNA polymerase-3 subunit alpha
MDSVTKYKMYIEKAKECGMTALAFSEHGNCFEWYHKKCDIEKAGMKYIHACEFYITKALYEYPEISDEWFEGNLGRDAKEVQEEYGELLEAGKKKIRDNYHCVLIAKNYEGFKELNELTSKSFNREDGHFYFNPRITYEELKNTSDNIIVATACLGGILNSNDEELEKDFLQWLADNKHRCFLEVQHHNTYEQVRYNGYLYQYSRKYGIPLIAGTDTHSLDERYAKGRVILQKAKDIFFDNEEGWDLTFKTYDELVKAYEEQGILRKEVYLEAIENTNRMADMVEEYTIDDTKKYPKLYADSEKALKEKIAKGIKWRGIDKKPNSKEYKDKILYEYDTYKYNDAIDFLLLEEDYKTALRKKGIPFGYSRGSVSGSIIAYLLGITEVDSIKYNLNFERFMNKERVSLADVDTDWFKRDRGEVRKYLYNKKGLYCCDIITFNTIAMKGAIKDVGRALGMSPDETQALSDEVFVDENKQWKIDNKYRKQYPELFEYVDIVQGVIVSIGNHPAGLVVSPFPVEPFFATCTTSENENPISQINMKEIDSLNFVKLDVLGLDCVGLINDTCDLVGIDRLTPDNVDLADMKVWDSIRDDNTAIFQFESDTAGGYLQELFSDNTIKNIKKVNPNFSYIDLMSMANGAIRPAGASYREELAKGIYRDNGHKALNEFLAPTLGYLVYQEQIIEFLHKFCGYTMGEADIVRRGFAKKTGTEKFIPKIKEGFMKTMKEEYGVDNEESEHLIESFIQVIIDASSYLFSNNHAVPYSFLGYMCGYLRYYYPLEFLTVALNVYQEDEEKSNKIKAYIKKMGIEINSIKFGKSKDDYFMDKDTNSIYQGIASIKYLNVQIAKELYDLSQNNTYNSFVDLLKDITQKTSCDSRQLKILISLNFFSDFGKNKKLMSIYNLYDNLADRKQLNSKDISTLHIDEDILQKYVGKRTAKLYKELDMAGYIAEVSQMFPDKSLSIREQMQYEIEHLGSPITLYKQAPKSFFVVTEYKTFKDKLKPYLTLYNVKTGEYVKTKIKDRDFFALAPFGLYDIIKAVRWKTQKKTRCIGGQWVKTNEDEQILSEWEVF